MKILITGAAGFIGSHTAERALRQGHSVVGLDNFNYYYNPDFKRENVAAINATAAECGSGDVDFVMIEGDIRDKALLNQIFSQHKPDAVIHLAANAGVRPSIKNPELYTEVNINGTVNLLECMRENEVKRLLFASSSSVYGNNQKLPFAETDFVDHPISPYAATKKAGELLCHTYHHLYGINVACLRFFTVYGPRQRPDLAIYKFTGLISQDKPVPVYGDGSTKRDYTFIGDILDGMFKALDYINSPQSRYDIFNLGESKVISLGDMISTIEQALGKKAVLHHMPSFKGDVECTFADISHSQTELGYNPVTNFEQGIEVFVEWYTANRM